MKKSKGLFQYVGDTPIIPISVKILAVFITLLLLSNFATNYINIKMNQRQIIKLTNQVLVNQLKELFTNAGNQFEIYRFSQDVSSAVDSLSTAAVKGFEYPNSLALGIKNDGSVLFSAAAKTNTLKISSFNDDAALKQMNDSFNAGTPEGSIYFKTEAGEYLGVYKYQEDWNCYLIRADLVKDLTASSRMVFKMISVVIIVLTILFLGVGIALFSNIMRYIRRMTDCLYKMQAAQSLDLLDLEGAPNDDITYLGVSFNALSSTINNLLGIFQKFVSKDVVDKAYSDHIINLEGQQRELTILFSDICGFTYMTETLGNDIINLLNIHYDRAIHMVHRENGIIGSIIGDAVLAVFGAIDNRNKSLAAIKAAWDITKVTAQLREKMIARRSKIESERYLTEAEERIYKAVLLDVGVGIDGGTVFYGNIGSSERMTNTVIGDNVNSSSRLEGLTRVYHVPVIVSQYVKDEAESASVRYKFYEIDTVQVKGKTTGKRVFFPLDTETADESYIRKFDIYALALQAYYQGDWNQARQLFSAAELDVAKVFLERMGSSAAPANWSGLWTMTTK